MLRLIALMGRPRVSPTTIRMAVRVPVPRSCVPAPAPGVDGESQAVLEVAGRLVGTRVPAPLPAHQLVGLEQFLAIDGFPRRQPQVLQEEVERVQIELGS